MSLISNKTIEQINALQLSEVIGRYVDIKKKGSNYVGLSPFSEEKTGSFNINDTKNIWKDFSSGKTGKNSISFVMELNQLSYPDAIKEIANKFTISPRTVEKHIVNIKGKLMVNTKAQIIEIARKAQLTNLYKE